jgi:hypothetical protein
MAFIGPWVHRYTIRSKTLYIYCSLNYIGIITTPAVTQRGYFIYVDRKFCHGAKIES